MKKELDKKVKELEEKYWKEKSDQEKLIRFDNAMRTIFLDILSHDNLSETINYTEMINSLFTMCMIKKFNDKKFIDNENIFIFNNKNDFYSFINNYSEVYDKNFDFIKRFVEEYVFN